jgi:hypothetical protein
MSTLTINFQLEDNKKKEINRTSTNEESKEYILIEPYFLKHLHKSWVKIEGSSTGVTGGFIVKYNKNSVSIRTPGKKELKDIIFDENTLFKIKEDDPNYHYLEELLIRESKMKYTQHKLDKELEEVEKIKNILKNKMKQ